MQLSTSLLKKKEKHNIFKFSTINTGKDKVQDTIDKGRHELYERLHKVHVH